MKHTSIHLNRERRIRVVTVGMTATACLYVLLVLVAEPIRGFAASSSDTDNVVSVTVEAGASISCTPNSLDLGTITDSGDIGEYNASRDVTCNVRTNNSAGYTLAWQVSTGSGGTSTGYMISQFEDVITPFRYDQSNAESTPTAWDGTSVPSTVSAWGGRLSSTSDNFGSSPLSWGTDTGDNTEKWLKVSSGSTTTIAASNTETTDSGDDHNIGFRAEVGSSKIQPTGEYQVTVEFTATTQ